MADNRSQWPEHFTRPEPEFVKYDFGEGYVVARITENAVAFRPFDDPGAEWDWIPKKQLEDAEDFRVGDGVQSIGLTEWILEKKGWVRYE